MPVTLDGTTGISLVQDGVIGTAKLAANSVTPAKTQAGSLPSMIKLGLANGYGTTNTKIRRFTNLLSTQGTDITYADSVTLGATFTINVAGVYSVSYSDQYNAASWIGLSLNSTSLSTNVSTITAPELITTATAGGIDYAVAVSSTLYLPSGSVIRAHTNGASTGVNTPICQLTITRVS